MTDDVKDVRQAIDAKLEKTQAVVEAVKVKLTAREECYQRIIDFTKESMAEYYTRHPERAVDERGSDATDWSVNGVKSILAILNEYSIAFRDGITTVPEKELTNEQQSPDTGRESGPASKL